MSGLVPLKGSDNPMDALCSFPRYLQTLNPKRGFSGPVDFGYRNLGGPFSIRQVDAQHQVSPHGDTRLSGDATSSGWEIH